MRHLSVREGHDRGGVCLRSNKRGRWRFEVSQQIGKRELREGTVGVKSCNVRPIRVDYVSLR